MMTFLWKRAELYEKALVAAYDVYPLETDAVAISRPIQLLPLLALTR
jgi:hypothetical protein